MLIRLDTLIPEKWDDYFETSIDTDRSGTVGW